MLTPENFDAKFPLALLHVQTFKEGVTYIYSYDTRAIVILNNQMLYRTSDEYLNVAHEKGILFNKRQHPVPLFPYKRILIPGSGHLLCDAQRSIISLEQPHSAPPPRVPDV